MNMAKWSLALGAIVAVLGCGPQSGGGSETGFLDCRSDAECPDGYACVDAVCSAQTSNKRLRGPDGGGGGNASAYVPSGGQGTPVDESTIAELDPHAKERRETAASYCALLDKHPCLGYVPARDEPATEGDPIESCRRDVEVEAANWSADCFVEWGELATCLTAAPWACPCAGDTCALGALGRYPTPFDGLCDDAWGALAACDQAILADGMVYGSRSQCYYRMSEEFGCDIECTGDLGVFDSRCDGPLGGAQACQCERAGAVLEDMLDRSFWWANDCVDAARQMANGLCEEKLSCCVSWMEDQALRCGCTADPTQGGFASCEEAATSVGGDVVAICPQYDSDVSAFPRP